MKRFLLIGCVLALAIGCGNDDSDLTEPLPPAPPQKKEAKAPAPMPTSQPPPSVPRKSQSTKKPRITPQARKEGLPELVQQYQSLAGRSAERSQLIADVAAMSGAASSPQAVAGALVDMLRMENDIDLKVEIINELSLLEHPAALDPLLTFSGAGQPPEVQEAAIDGADTLLTDLAFTDDPAMLEPIIKATGSQYPPAIRESAISALEDLDNDRAIPVLQNLVNDPNPDIAQAAAAAIDWLKE